MQTVIPVPSISISPISSCVISGCVIFIEISIGTHPVVSSHVPFTPMLGTSTGSCLPHWSRTTIDCTSVPVVLAE